MLRKLTLLIVLAATLMGSAAHAQNPTFTKTLVTGVPVAVENRVAVSWHSESPDFRLRAQSLYGRMPAIDMLTTIGAYTGPYPVQLDESGRYLYYPVSAQLPSRGSVRVIDLVTGTDIQVVAESYPSLLFNQIAVDGSYLYWIANSSTNNSATVKRQSLPDGQIETLAVGVRTDFWNGGIAVKNGWLYHVKLRVVSQSASGEIWRWNLQTGVDQRLTTAPWQDIIHFRVSRTGRFLYYYGSYGLNVLDLAKGTAAESEQYLVAPYFGAAYAPAWDRETLLWTPWRPWSQGPPSMYEHPNAIQFN